MSEQENKDLKMERDRPMPTRQFSRQISLPKVEHYKKPMVFQKTIVVLFASFSTLIMFVLRYNLSVAIVAIIDEQIDVKVLRNSSLYNNLTTNQNNYNLSDYIMESKKKFDWNENTQGQILASYFYGYTIFQVPLGRLSEKFGAKWVLGLGTFIPGILTFLTPFTIELGSFYTVFLRFLLGALHASVICSCYTLISCWIPEKEKGNSIVWIHLSFEIGGIVSLFLSGYICSNEYLGWEYSFYLLSFFAFVWFIPYCFLVYSEPNQCPRLSKFEKKLLDQSKTIENSKDDFSRKIVKVPPKLDFKKILTSGPVWASCIAKLTSNFGFYLISTKMPTYLKEIFKISVSENGFLSSLPYLGSLISKIICLKLLNFMINRKLMSLTNLRKFFQTISMLVPALSLFLITVKNDDKNLAIFFIVLAMFGHGFYCGGDAPMVSEYSGDLSGTIFGFTNTFACVDGFIAPIFVGVVINYCEDIYFGWNIIFYVGTFLYIIGCIFFLIFASSELQPWAVTTYKEVIINEEKNKEISVA